MDNAYVSENDELGKEPFAFPTPFHLTVDGDYPFAPGNGLRSLLRRGLAAVVRLIFAPFFRAFYDFQVEGAQYLADLEGGAVTVCNHVSSIDCVMLASAFWPRSTWFLSLKSNFEIPVIRHLIRALGAIPIPDTVSGFAAMQRAVRERIKQGDLVQIYPEGSLRPGCRVLRPFQRGAFKIAADCDAPVLPCVLKIFRDRCGKKRVRLTILPPVSADFSLSPRRRAAALAESCRAAMERELQKAVVR